MTVSTQTYRVTRFWQLGVATIECNIPVDAPEDIIVTAKDASGADVPLAAGVHFLPVRDETTAQLSLSVIAMPADELTLQIERRTPALQTVDLTNNVTYDPEAVERALDRSAMRDAEMQGTIEERAVLVPVGQTAPLLDIASLKGKTVGVNLGGEFVAVEQGGAALEVFSGIMNVPADYPTIAAALEKLKNKPCSDVTILVSGHHVEPAPVAWNHPYGEEIKLRGQTVLDRRITSVASVTGAPKAYTVQYVLDDISNVEVGDGALIRNVTPGTQPPGEYTTRPIPGALHRGFYTMGYATNVQGQTAVALSKTVANTHLAAGDLYIAKGEIIPIQTVNVGGDGFTLAWAPANGAASFVGWLHCRALAGTVAVAADIATFTTAPPLLDLGAVLLFAGYGAAVVIERISATQWRLDRTWAIPAGTICGFYAAGEEHNACAVITAVDVPTKTITLVSKAATINARPPVLSVTGGDIFICKSTVTFPADTDGFRVEDCWLDYDHILLVGQGASELHKGVDLGGVDHNSPDNAYGHGGIAGNVKAGPRAGITGFGKNIFAASFAKIFAAATWSTGANHTNLYANFRCDVIDPYAVLNHGGKWGEYWGPGTGGDFTNSQTDGCGIFGRHWIDAGMGYGEYPYASGNGMRAIHCDGNVKMHFNGLRAIANHGEAIGSDNGLEGRGSETVMIANLGAGANIVRGNVEMQYICAISNGTDILANNSRVNISEGGAGGSSIAIRGMNGSVITAKNFGLSRLTTGVNIDGIGTNISLDGSGLSNVVTAIYYRNAALATIKSVYGAWTLNPATRNRPAADWAMVSDGGETASEPLWPRIAFDGSGVRETQFVAAPPLTANLLLLTTPNLARYIHLSSDGVAAWEVQSMLAGMDGETRTLVNVGATALNITGENPAGAAANRFNFAGTLALRPKETATFRYSTALARWLHVAAGQMPVVEFYDVQIITANGNWIKPAGAIDGKATLVGAGGNGGSGSAGDNTANRGGGAGGGAGGVTEFSFNAADLPASVAVTIGTAPAAAAGVTGAGVNGNAGGAGGTTTFGSYAAARGGAGGNGGLAAGTAATAGNAGSAISVTMGASGGVAPGNGAAGAASGAGAAGNRGGRPEDAGGPGGGGGGAGKTTAAQAAGGAGGAAQGSAGLGLFQQTASVSGGGGTAGAAGAAGGVGADGARPWFGDGGGGGGSSLTGNGGAGGNGGAAGGGGGGAGAALNTGTSGAGGVGGRGEVRVVTRCRV